MCLALSVEQALVQLTAHACDSDEASQFTTLASLTLFLSDTDYTHPVESSMLEMLSFGVGISTPQSAVTRDCKLP